jgi:hypothetical protein
MAEWLVFDQWKECAELERPGFIFEVSNAEGHSLFTPCMTPLQLPWDWKSGPVRFRLVEAQKPRHSTPIPAPKPQQP